MISTMLGSASAGPLPTLFGEAKFVVTKSGDDKQSSPAEDWFAKDRTRARSRPQSQPWGRRPRRDEHERTFAGC
jgi:hypothetical protein